MNGQPDFAAAYNLDRRCLPVYRKCGIKEIFAGINFPTIFGSGRVRHGNRPVSYEELGRHFSEARRLGLKTTFLFNPACTGSKEWTAAGMNEIAHIVRFINRHPVDYLVVAQPFFANVFRRLCPSVKIKLSAHYNVNDMGTLDFALRRIGVDVVVISQFANKNFRFLREAVETFGPERLEILCSVSCIAGCPYRAWHLQAMAHVRDMDPDLVSPAMGDLLPCCADKVRNPHMMMSSMFIRREDLSYYRKLGINRFKIGERMAGTACNNAFVRYYTGKVRKPPRQMIEIMFRGCVDQVNFDAMDGYYEKFFRGECDGTRYDCTECDHCSKYARRVFGINPKLKRKVPPDHHHGYYANYAEYINHLLSSLDG